MERSEHVGNLAKALSQAQAQFKSIKRECSNPFFRSRYADLAAIIDATRDALSKNGLAVVQTVSPGESLELETTLMHESGEWLSSKLVLKPKADDPQAAGSAMTYARRYSLGAILNVASEDDDDGNSASKGGGDNAGKPPATPPAHQDAPQAARQPQVSNPDSPATEAQKKAIHTILSKIGVTDRDAQLARMNEILKPELPITTSAALCKGEASVLIDALGKELKL